MKISKSEIIKIITAIKIQCPEALQYKNTAELSILADMWYETLKDYSQEIVWKATQNALKNAVYQKYNWIGLICQEIEKMNAVNEKTDGELWTELISVLDNVDRIMHFGTEIHWSDGRLINPIEEVKAIFDKCDPIIQRYLGNVTGLIAIAKEEDLSYEKGRFQKAVDGLRKREKIKQEMDSEWQKLSGKPEVKQVGHFENERKYTKKQLDSIYVDPKTLKF